MRPKKSLGQHFLTDKRYAQKIVDAIEPASGDLIIEIGPGTGALTELILACEGITYTGIEIDREAVQLLTDRFGQTLDIRCESILDFDMSTIQHEGPVKFIGNLPYYITSQILFHLKESAGSIDQIVVMMQREVAERIVARPGSRTYGIISVLLQQMADIKLLFKVPAGVFFPVPNVESAVIRLKPYQSSPYQPDNPDLFKQVVKTAFMMRRKTLRNNLKGIIKNFSLYSLDFSRRAETLSVEEFVGLSNEINRLRSQS